jgi:outer membrane protein OmpA-like peptidoglycan-associated protein
MHHQHFTLPILISLGALGCGASAPTVELVTARSAFAEARDGPTAAINPKGLYDAEQALHDAERAHEADPGSPREKHFAYVATRKSQLSVAEGNGLIARKEVAAGAADYTSILETKVKALSAEREGVTDQLETARRELSDVRGELSTTGENLDRNAAELRDKEKQLAARVAELEAATLARQQAEEKTAKARADLAELATVRDEGNRLVISLSGSVLFKSGSSDLMEMAKRRLDTVTDAIEGYGSGTIAVEGHTDSQGTEAYNVALSLRRAEAVRGYLVSRGMSSERVSAVGRGEGQPIAGNDTPEGRANNRRVEIIVEGPKAPPKLGKLSPTP